MSLEIQIAEAIWPKPCVVLGVRLRPLAIGHWFNLLSLRSGFLLGRHSEATLPDLVASVLVCSEGWQEFRTKIEQGQAAAEVEAWGRRLRGRSWFRKRRTIEEITGFDFFAERAAFVNYMRLSMPRPVTQPVAKGESINPGSPEPVILLAKLMGDFGMGLNEAMDTSIAFARWILAVNSERLGKVVVVDKEEVGRMKQKAEELYEAWKAGKLPKELQ